MCVCVRATVFVQLSAFACLLVSVFLLPSGSSFQDGSMGFLAGPSSRQFLLGDNGRSPTGA